MSQVAIAREDAALRRRAAAGRRHAVVLIEAGRPRQWLKNVLVLAAPAAGGALAHPRAWPELATMVAAFCAVSAAGYLLNDVHDAPEDRRHPVKRVRPVASYRLPARTALRAAAAAAAVGLAGAAVVSPRAAAVLAAYALLTACYSLWLRRVAGVELLAVAGCHLLRMLGGAVAAGIPPSRFLMAVVSAGALLVVAGRRLAELRESAAGMPARATLRAYSRGLLGGLVHGAALLTLVAYALWAANPTRSDDPTAAAVSAVVLCGFIWRYLRLLAAGRGSAPEELVLGDPALLALALAWALAFAGAVYA